jgi:hypothetical protein
VLSALMAHVEHVEGQAVQHGTISDAQLHGLQRELASKLAAAAMASWLRRAISAWRGVAGREVQLRQRIAHLEELTQREGEREAALAQATAKLGHEHELQLGELRRQLERQHESTVLDEEQRADLEAALHAEKAARADAEALADVLSSQLETIVEHGDAVTRPALGAATFAAGEQSSPRRRERALFDSANWELVVDDPDLAPGAVATSDEDDEDQAFTTDSDEDDEEELFLPEGVPPRTPPPRMPAPSPGSRGPRGVAATPLTASAREALLVQLHGAVPPWRIRINAAVVATRALDAVEAATQQDDVCFEYEPGAHVSVLEVRQSASGEHRGRTEHGWVTLSNLLQDSVAPRSPDVVARDSSPAALRTPAQALFGAGWIVQGATPGTASPPALPRRDYVPTPSDYELTPAQYTDTEHN